MTRESLSDKHSSKNCIRPSHFIPTCMRKRIHRAKRKSWPYAITTSSTIYPEGK